MFLLKRLFFMLLLAFSFSCNAKAQSLILKTEKNLNYKQEVTPALLDNYHFSTYYATGKNVYNLKGFVIARSRYKVQSIKVNPAGGSFALLDSNGKKSTVKIYDANVPGKVLHEFSDVTNATAVSYSADSRLFMIATSNSSLLVYNTKGFMRVRTLSLPFVPTIMCTSANGYHVAVASLTGIAVVDLESGSVRMSDKYDGNIKDVSFTGDSECLGVLLASGKLHLYGTRTFNVEKTFDVPSKAESLTFHPEGKYAAVASGGNTLLFVDLTSPEKRYSISELSGSVNYARFLTDGKSNIYLSYNSFNSIKYKLIKGFSPNYSRMLREELTMRMEEWAKMRDDETFEEFQLRVNDDTRMQQARLFEQEIATRMADDAVMKSEVSLGGYNLEKGMLTLDFDNMPPIALAVPQNEVQDFMDPENLEFRDVKYGITDNDGFELIYANVYNKKTGKTYEFDNLERSSLEYLICEEDFVPIELVQQSGMEEVKLNSIKRNIVAMAKQNNIISDHTDIQVNTAVVSDVDAMGNKIANYKVGFKYQVEAEFSEIEDFPAGKYAVEHSPAAESMLKIIKQAFETDFSSYIKAGKKLIVNVTGSADALPVTGIIHYDGRYGDFNDEPYYLDGNLNLMSVTRAGGIKDNSQLAFIRAAAVKDYVEKNVPELSGMNVVYNSNIELSDEKGGAFRRISVEFIFVDAFKID